MMRTTKSSATTLTSTTENTPVKRPTTSSSKDSTLSSVADKTLSTPSTTTTSAISASVSLQANNYTSILADTSTSTKLDITMFTAPIQPTQPSSTASEISHTTKLNQANSTSSFDISTTMNIQSATYIFISTKLTPNTSLSTKTSSSTALTTEPTPNTSPSTRSTSNKASSIGSTSSTDSSSESSLNTGLSPGSSSDTTPSTNSTKNTTVKLTESTSNTFPSLRSTSNTTSSTESSSITDLSTGSTSNITLLTRSTSNASLSSGSDATTALSTNSTSSTALSTRSSSDTNPPTESTSNNPQSTDSTPNIFPSVGSPSNTSPSSELISNISSSTRSTSNDIPLSSSITAPSTLNTASSTESTSNIVLSFRSTSNPLMSTEPSRVPPSTGLTSKASSSIKSTSHSVPLTDENFASSEISKVPTSIDENAFTLPASPITVSTQSRLTPSTKSSLSLFTETDKTLTTAGSFNTFKEVNSSISAPSKTNPTSEAVVSSTLDDQDYIELLNFRIQQTQTSFENGSNSVNTDPLIRKSRGVISIYNESAFTEFEDTTGNSASRNSKEENSNVETNIKLRTNVRTFLKNRKNLEQEQEEEEREEHEREQEKKEEKFIRFSNGPYYSPGKHHEIIIDFGPNSVKDLKLQVTETGSEAVGDFIHLPSGSKAISCKGRLRKNTFIKRKLGYTLSSLTIIWRAPLLEYAPKSLMYRALYNTSKMEFGMLTRIDNIPPFSTSDCGKRNASIFNVERNEETREDISCFRACPADNSDCTFSQSIFGVKIIKNTDGKLDITMGANTGNDYNYVAMGQTEDSKTLKNSDINICYKNNTFADGSSIRFGHKFLLHLNHTFLNHEGDISLVSAFMDNESLWCRFQRPFRGSHVSRMNVDKPSYFFFFIGRYIDGEFINPNLNEIMMTSDRRSLKNGLLGNEKLMLLRESEAQKLCESKFIIVTVLFVFFLL